MPSGEAMCLFTNNGEDSSQLVSMRQSHLIQVNYQIESFTRTVRELIQISVRAYCQSTRAIGGQRLEKALNSDVFDQAIQNMPNDCTNRDAVLAYLLAAIPGN
jgi:hypothetical protein